MFPDGQSGKGMVKVMIFDTHAHFDDEQFDTDRDAFIGMSNGFGDPAVVTNNAPTDSIADGWSPIASHCKKITLAPGESKTLVFVLGYVVIP